MRTFFIENIHGYLLECARIYNWELSSVGKIILNEEDKEKYKKTSIEDVIKSIPKSQHKKLAIDFLNILNEKEDKEQYKEVIEKTQNEFSILTNRDKAPKIGALNAQKLFSSKLLNEELPVDLNLTLEFFDDETIEKVKGAIRKENNDEIYVKWWMEDHLIDEIAKNCLEVIGIAPENYEIESYELKDKQRLLEITIDIKDLLTKDDVKPFQTAIIKHCGPSFFKEIEETIE